MAVPTLTTVSPSNGPTGGQQLVTLTGTNFRLPVIPTDEIVESDANSTVLVLFGGVPGEGTACLDATTAVSIPPPHVAGTVAVTIMNLDPLTGVPVSGEQATLSDGYTYAAPVHTSERESDLVRLTRALLQFFKLKLGVTTTYAVHTDYDPTTGDELHVTEFASLPGISLVGPELSENRFYSINVAPTFDDPTSVEDGYATAFVSTPVPYTVDVKWTIVGASNSKMELLNLMSNFVALMHRTKFFVMLRNDADESKGTVRYEMDFEPDGEPKATMTSGSDHTNNSNLRSFHARIIIRGFNVESFSGVNSGVGPTGVPNHAITEQGHMMETLRLDVYAKDPDDG